MPEADYFWSRVLDTCRRVGMSQKELAQRANLSRTTLYQLAQGKTSRPQATTVHRIATALGVSVDSLLEPPANPPLTLPAILTPDAAQFAEFNRLTNPHVETVRHAQPELFHGWTSQDWEELYSCFGVGGSLSPAGVTQEAARINQKRELLRKLEVILETHLREATTGLINSLYDSIVVGPGEGAGESGPAHDE